MMVCVVLILNILVYTAMPVVSESNICDDSGVTVDCIDCPEERPKK